MMKYCEMHDASFDSESGEWLEKECSDPTCPYCNERPKKHEEHNWVFSDGVEGVCK